MFINEVRNYRLNKFNLLIFSLIVVILFVTLFSCNTVYQFQRVSTQPVKDNFDLPEKSELGKFANSVDANIRINLLLAIGTNFVIKSDSTIYKDKVAIQSQNSNTSTANSNSIEYEITYKDIGSTFISFTPICLNGKRVSKVLKVQKKDATSFYLIANIPLIFYLSGVISAEMGKSFPAEALKAQAVAARTYFYVSKLNNKPYDIENSVNFQVFNLDNLEYFLPIVAEVDNLVLTYKGEIFPTYFHSHSGGILTTPELVWGSKDPKSILSQVYRVKEDYYSSESYKWTAEIGRFFLKTLFARAGFDVDGYCSNIEIASIGPDKRISQLKLTFSNGKIIEIKGDAFRKVVGTTVIKSTNFTFSYNASSQNYIFNGAGYGHGIGMSQYGAKAMAEQGFKYESILLFYYNDVEIKKYR